MGDMVRAQSLREKRLERLVEQLVERIAEEAPDLRISEDNRAALINDEQRVRRKVEQALEGRECCFHAYSSQWRPWRRGWRTSWRTARDVRLVVICASSD